jgi:cysteine-rich repeat protein
MPRNLIFVTFATMTLAACGLDDGSGTPEKRSLLQASEDPADVCARLGLSPGCDLCAEFGWYGDGACDQVLIDRGLCLLADSDCQGAEMDCGNGLDDDGDGVVDCTDPDCWADPACGAATCGNGVVDAGEECDDGNAVNGDGCDVTCMLETNGELCSDRLDNDGDGLVDCADPDCASYPGCAGYCGDGILDAGEECDDGNDVDGDGCGTDCLVEGTETVCDDGLDDDGDGLVDCADPQCYEDSSCAPVCGNGIVEEAEMCDDGNALDGDGCSASCMLEENAFDCNNGIDDDRDGLVDCADPDCAADPACTH